MTNEELRELMREYFRSGLGDVADTVLRLLDENDRMRKALVRVRDYGKLPLTELTDTDEERATAYRAQLEVQAYLARTVLSGGDI